MVKRSSSWRGFDDEITNPPPIKHTERKGGKINLDRDQVQELFVSIVNVVAGLSLDDRKSLWVKLETWAFQNIKNRI